MDLEKMHVNLYKRKYLTPHDFLDDIRKIVHNAHLRIAEDMERFYKAQAMVRTPNTISENPYTVHQDTVNYLLFLVLVVLMA
jgi:hypothetical protein